MLQIASLEDKLGALHGTDASALRRTHNSLTQHVQTLAVEVKDLQIAASNIDDASIEFDKEMAIREVSACCMHLHRNNCLPVSWHSMMYTLQTTLLGIPFHPRPSG